MRSLCALSLAATFACAAGSSPPRSSSAAVSKPEARSCAPMVPAIAYRGTELYPGPDSSGAPVATLKQDTPVCASAERAGFGYRRVKLSNGQSGFAAENSLTD